MVVVESLAVAAVVEIAEDWDGDVCEEEEAELAAAVVDDDEEKSVGVLSGDVASSDVASPLRIFRWSDHASFTPNITLSTPQPPPPPTSLLLLLLLL